MFLSFSCVYCAQWVTTSSAVIAQRKPAVAGWRWTMLGCPLVFLAVMFLESSTLFTATT